MTEYKTFYDVVGIKDGKPVIIKKILRRLRKNEVELDKSSLFQPIPKKYLSGFMLAKVINDGGGGFTQKELEKMYNEQENIN